MSDPIELSKATSLEAIQPGQYYPVQFDEKQSATFRCPRCEHHQFIHEHTINADGSVEPSVVCCCFCGCEWIADVKLLGWMG